MEVTEKSRRRIQILYMDLFAGKFSRTLTQPFRANPVKGTTKYGAGNQSTMRLHGPILREEEWRQLEDLYSYGLAKGTWASYKTAERLLATCFKEKDMKLELPLEVNQVLIYIHWLAFKRGVTAATINNYLSGVRQLHIAKGIDNVDLRTPRIVTLLEGLKNKEMAEKREQGKEKRKPITIEILKMLKNKLAEAPLCGTDQRMMWTASTVMFHGAFRVHEILSKEVKKFDPAFTLLSQDVLLQKGTERAADGSVRSEIRFRIKAPKENKAGTSIIVDVYETKTDICPVRAFKKWDQFRSGEEGQPLFRFKDGTPLTGRRFNQILRDSLRGLVPDVDTLFSSHSFRAGAASMMAALGYSDKDIKVIGRWNSRSFEEYIKVPRTKRIAVAKVWSLMK